jgi:DNA-binding LytR/AlgR family response regulator
MNPRIADAPGALPSPTPDLRLGLMTWAAFIVATCAYCLLHQAFVSAVTPNPQLTLIVALREWGAWALLAPLALRAFRQMTPVRDILTRCAVFALLAAALPITVDLLTEERGLRASFALFWPRNLAMAVAMLCIARAFTRSGLPQTLRAGPDSNAERPATLMVSKGADQCLIRVDDIEHLTAAGNYVDIRAGDQNYLMRITMGDIETLLPTSDFVRIHRRHIVRVRDIERIRIERSGSGAVHLRSGSTLAISRGYRAQLEGRVH